MSSRLARLPKSWRLRKSVRSFLFAAAALALTPWLASADEAPKPVPAAPAITDVQDFVFLGEARPVRLRLHLQVDGKSYLTAWFDFLQKFHQYLDRDGDGFLNKDEAARVPKPQTLLQMRQSGYFVVNQAGYASLAELDTILIDGKVSVEELVDYYRRGNVRAFQLAPNQNFGAQPGVLTEVLFKHLDANHDSKLTKEELATATTTLRRLDTDDDELVAIQELTQNPNAGFVGQTLNVVQGRPGPVSTTLLPVDPGDNAERLAAEALLAHYDKDKNQKLSKTEIDKSVFDQLDANVDGMLEVAELIRVFRKVPEVELVVRLGRTDARQGIERVNVEPQTLEVKQNGNGVAIALGKTQIELNRGESAVMVQNSRMGYKQLFMAADNGKKGFLEPKDVQPPQFQFLRGLFPFVDRDGDNKLTEMELNAFMDLQTQAIVSYTTLTPADNGQSLFEIVDANRDGRLGVRELRTLWDRLSVLDGEGKGHVVKADLPRQVQITVGRGGQAYFGNRRVVVGGGFNVNTRQPGPVAVRGPLWFRKMDRNGDGDVSRREFLGTDDDFKLLDRDGDGLIDLSEAEQAGNLTKKSDESKQP